MRAFTMSVILERLERRGDLFLPVLGKGINLEASRKRFASGPAGRSGG